MQYYYSDGHSTFGPVSLEDLRLKISPNTLVWREGMANWAPASNVEEVRALFERPASPFTPIPTPSPQPAPEPDPTPVSDSKKPKTKKNIGLILMAVLECIWAVFLILNYLVSLVFETSYQSIIYSLCSDYIYNYNLYKVFDFVVSLPYIGFWLFSLLFSVVALVKALKR